MRFIFHKKALLTQSFISKHLHAAKQIVKIMLAITKFYKTKVGYRLTKDCTPFGVLVCALVVNNFVA